MKKLKVVLLLVLLVFITGCFDYEEVLEINENGSGTVQMHYTFDKAYLQQYQTMIEKISEQTGENTKPEPMGETMFSKGKIEESLKLGQSGIKMLFYEFSETDKAQIWDMKFAFTDLNNLDELGAVLFPDEEDESDTGESVSIMTKQSDGTWLFVRSLNDDRDNVSTGSENSQDYSMYDDEEENYPEEEVTYPEDLDLSELGMMGDSMQELMAGLSQMTEQMKQMEKDAAKHKISFTVKFPGKILETNATSTNGTTAVWEYNLKQMSENTPPMRAVIAP
ncbi:MAG: hypothetical protein ACE5D6_06605 [Candidatus Zixiibacteriota bacterium]